MKTRRTVWTLGALFAWAAVASWAHAGDWPTYQHDNRRSATTDEQFKPKALKEAWRFDSPYAPQPAWYGPAKWDAYAAITPLRSMRNYDPVYHVIAVGDAVYFGSSSDDSVHCIDAATGAERWAFTTDGPVRVPPTCWEGRLYFGSDDGHAYCIEAADGALVWKYRPSEDTRLIPNDGKLVSVCPCRTGVLVSPMADGESVTAYFGAGLLPWRPAYLCAVDIATGKPEGPGRFQAVMEGVTLEGAMLASPTKLYAPQGRSAPMVFQRTDGKHLGNLEGGGGVFAVLTPDHQIVHGPGNKTGWITASNSETRDKVATFDGGRSMIVTESRAFVLKDAELTALDRATGKPVWKQESRSPFAMILTGDVLWVGGDDVVVARSVANGAVVAEKPVKGRAFGLAAANGRLYVSTDTGAIHCFK